MTKANKELNFWGDYWRGVFPFQKDKVWKEVLEGKQITFCKGDNDVICYLRHYLDRHSPVRDKDTYFKYKLVVEGPNGSDRKEVGSANEMMLAVKWHEYKFDVGARQ